MAVRQKEYYSSSEAAALLDVAVSTIQLWTNNGLLSAWTTNGGHRRISRISVEEMLRQRQADAGSNLTKKPLSVVVVEDNSQQIRLYNKLFSTSELDTQLITATNGYEGLIKIGQALPDVIIADLIMPKMDGFEMVEALRERPELAHCLIIIVTGLQYDEITEKGSLPEGVHLFTKPVPFEKIELLIRQKVNIKVA